MQCFFYGFTPRGVWGAVGVKFSGRGCLGVRSRRVGREVSRFSKGLCLRLKNGLFSSRRTDHILPNFRPSDGLHVFRGVDSDVRVIVIVDTTSVRGGGGHTSLNVACSRSILHLHNRFRGHNFVINSIIVARFGNRPTTVTFGRHLRHRNVGACYRCLVRNCPRSMSLVTSSRNFNGGSCMRARHPLIVIATPNPNDNGVTIYLDRLCGRGGHNIHTNCTGFRAFPM